MKTMVCSDSGKQYTDVSFSEIRNEQFVCGECGSHIRFPEGTKLKGNVTVVVPRHTVPDSVMQYRATLERASKSENKRVR